MVATAVCVRASARIDVPAGIVTFSCASAISSSAAARAAAPSGTAAMLPKNM